MHALSLLCIHVDIFVSDHVEATARAWISLSSSQLVEQRSQMVIEPYEPGASACAQYY